MSANSPILIDDDSPLSSTEESLHDDTPPKVIASVANGRAQKPFVSLPRFSSERKRLYKPLNLGHPRADLDALVDEVIGEYREGSTLYYFARYDGGIARKVSVLQSTVRFSRLD